MGRVRHYKRRITTKRSGDYWDRYKARREREWNSLWYKKMRQMVFARDNWTCALTGRQGGNLHLHHIKRYVDYPALRFDPRNLITLSAEAHEMVTGQEQKYVTRLWKLAQQRERLRKNRVKIDSKKPNRSERSAKAKRNPSRYR